MLASQTVLILDCTRHSIKTRNYSQLEDKEKVRVENEFLYNSCRYQLQLKAIESSW